MSQSQLSIPAPVVTLINDQPATTSLAIAECFDKRHCDVMRDIQNLIENCPADFHKRNFALMSRKVKIGNGAEREEPYYIVYFDGFMLLVMGYTGKKALQMKLAYIEAFNAMREKLEAAKKKELPQADAPITPPMQAIIQMLVKARVEQHPDTKGRRALYPQIYVRLNHTFGIPRYTELPQSRLAEAVAYLVNMEIRPAKKVEPAPEQAKLEAAPMESLAIDAESYKRGKRLFDELEELKAKTENLRQSIHFTGRPGARKLGASEEKKVLYDNMNDCITAAVIGIDVAFLNLRSACRIGSQTDFLK